MEIKILIQFLSMEISSKSINETYHEFISTRDNSKTITIERYTGKKFFPAVMKWWKHIRLRVPPTLKLYHSLDITARSAAVCACPQLVILCDAMIAPRPQKELLLSSLPCSRNSKSIKLSVLPHYCNKVSNLQSRPSPKLPSILKY